MQSSDSRIDIELKKTINAIKENKNYEILQLPDYIYEEQSRVEITIGNKTSKMRDENKTKTTYKLDLYVKMNIKNKVLVIPAGISNLIITNPIINCNIDFSDAVDLEYLEYGYYALGARMANLSDDEPKILQWPSNLKYLILHNYPFPLSNLPNGLLYLRLPSSIYGALDNLPASLIGLVFASASSCRRYNMGLNFLPLGLRYLALPGKIECELCNLPHNLEVLNLGADEYTQSLNCLSDSIQYLKLGNSSIPITKLPSALKELTIFYDTVANNGLYCRDTYDILADMNFPAGFEKLIIIDDTMQANTNIRLAIQDLIKEKSTSPDKLQIKIEYQ